MKSQVFQNKLPLIEHRFRNFTIAEDQLQKEEKQLITSLNKQKEKRKKYKKVVAGNQTAFDITQFFYFKKKENFTGSLIEQLSGGHWAWLVLLYSMVNNALVLPWMMRIDADKFLRLAWRHMLLNIVLIPFILYEKRSTNQEVQQKYKSSNIFKVQSLKTAFLVALSKSFWFVIITSTFQFTFIAHTLILGSMMNFFLSINRFLSSSYHFLEPGGQVFVVIGIILILKDQILADTQNIDTSYRLIGFSKYPWEIRIIADFIALFVSFIMAFSSKYTSNLNKQYTSYLGLFIVNSMIALLMFLAAYIFHGASFDTDENFGIFGIFGGSHFTTFFQLSVFIGFGMLWSYTMISNLFPQSLIPSLASVFQPVISLIIMDSMLLQQIPNGYTMTGYIFIIPGMFSILIGQNVYQKMKKAQQKQLQQKIQSIIEMSMVINKSQMRQVDSPLRFNKMQRQQSCLNRCPKLSLLRKDSLRMKKMQSLGESFISLRDITTNFNK